MRGCLLAALNVLPCDNHVAEQLVVDPRFKLLSFTGSVAVGLDVESEVREEKGGVGTGRQCRSDRRSRR